MELSRKLQIRAGQSVAILSLPAGLALPELGATADSADLADVVIGFVANREDLRHVGQVIAAAQGDRVAWLGYPKAGQLGTDLNRDRLAEAVASFAVQPVRQVSIDEVWSALRLRPAAAVTSPP